MTAAIQVGQTLSASSGTSPTTYSYQWRGRDSGGGAEGARRRLGAGVVGHRAKTGGRNAEQRRKIDELTEGRMLVCSCE